MSHHALPVCNLLKLLKQAGFSDSSLPADNQGLPSPAGKTILDC